MTAPHYGDGITYEGECICHGVPARGQIIRGRPGPFLASLDPFGRGPRVRVIMVNGDRGVHEIPVKGIRRL